VTSRYEELVRAALAEVTAAANVGDWVEDRVREDAPGVTDVVYASAQTGYRGWSWVVSVAEVEGEEPTVLELGLLPGEDSLVAPEWIPWSVRLAEWQAQQAAAAEAEAEEGSGDGDTDADDADDDGDAEDDDLDDLDDDDDLEEADDDVLDDDIPLEDLIGADADADSDGGSDGDTDADDEDPAS